MVTSLQVVPYDRLSEHRRGLSVFSRRKKNIQLNDRIIILVSNRTKKKKQSKKKCSINEKKKI